MPCRTLCWPPNRVWLVTVLPQNNVRLHFELFSTAFLMVVGGWGCGKCLEIDESCISKRKCNWSRLCATAWVFGDVGRELGTPVLHLKLITPLRHCLPSLRCVSYPSPQSSVTFVGTTFVCSTKYSHTTPLIAPLLWHDAHTNTMEATWKPIIYLRPYWENKVKYMINSSVLYQLSLMMFQNEM